MDKKQKIKPCYHAHRSVGRGKQTGPIPKGAKCNERAFLSRLHCWAYKQGCGEGEGCEKGSGAGDECTVACERKRETDSAVVVVVAGNRHTDAHDGLLLATGSPDARC